MRHAIEFFSYVSSITVCTVQVHTAHTQLTRHCNCAVTLQRTGGSVSDDLRTLDIRAGSCAFIAFHQCPCCTVACTGKMYKPNARELLRA